MEDGGMERSKEFHFSRFVDGHAAERCERPTDIIPLLRRRRGRFVAPRAVDSAAMALGKKFWGTVVFILITEMCERLAYYGLTGSLQIFFQSKLGMAGVRARALAELQRAMHR